MSATQPSFRWRTILELAVIGSVIYFFIGAPGLSDFLTSGKKGVVPAPKIHLKPDSLVYPDLNLDCAKHNYDVHIFSAKPLIVYIDGFLTEGEADALVELSQDKWQPSTVFNGDVESANDKVRKSDKALVPRSPLVQCIESRALAFQGWPNNTFIERIWTQRYNVSGHYARHYDWSSASREARRSSTFGKFLGRYTIDHMVYLSAACEGGGTEFPMLDARREGRWCDFLECDNGREGVTFKPRKGAAVFWLNFDEEGRGLKETVHAGLPVTSGVKVGLNIWSWWQRGLEAEHLREEI